MSVNLTNLERAKAAWGIDMPPWVRLLAGACDVTNQRAVGDRLGIDSAHVSRLINRKYGASYENAELLVRSRLGAEDVLCPIWRETIPLRSCIRSRRRKGTPQNLLHRLHAQNCPTCPNNTDRAAAELETED